jgi:hypothetical protein
MLAGLFFWLRLRRKTACRRCPHHRDDHKPYIPGDSRPGYCGSCGCYQYKPERAWTLALAFLRERPAPIPVDVLRPHPVPFPVRDSAEDDGDTTQFGLRVGPYLGDLDEARLRVPRQRRGSR